MHARDLFNLYHSHEENQQVGCRFKETRNVTHDRANAIQARVECLTCKVIYIRSGGPPRPCLKIFIECQVFQFILIWQLKQLNAIVWILKKALRIQRTNLSVHFMGPHTDWYWYIPDILYRTSTKLVHGEHTNPHTRHTMESIPNVNMPNQPPYQT